MEQHLAHVAFCETVGGFDGNQAALDGALLHTLIIDPAPVIFDFKVDVVATVIGAQRDFSRRGLARCNAVAAELDSMRHGIAHQMDERIGNLLNNVVIEFGLASGEFQLDFLIRGLCRIAHRARKARIQRANRYHARRRNFILQVMRKMKLRRRAWYRLARCIRAFRARCAMRQSPRIRKSSWNSPEARPNSITTLFSRFPIRSSIWCAIPWRMESSSAATALQRASPRREKSRCAPITVATTSTLKSKMTGAGSIINV